MMKSIGLTLLLATSLIQAAPAPAAPIEVHYSGERQPDKYNFDECFPFQNDGAAISQASFATGALCSWYNTDECEDIPTPLALAFRAGPIPGTAFSQSPNFKGAFSCKPYP